MLYVSDGTVTLSIKKFESISDFSISNSYGINIPLFLYMYNVYAFLFTTRMFIFNFYSYHINLCPNIFYKY